MYCISLSSVDGKQDVGLRRRRQRVQSSSVCVNSSVFLRKSPPRKRTHFLRRPFIARFSCMCICCSAQPHPSAGMWLLLLISVEWRGTCCTPSPSPSWVWSPKTKTFFLPLLSSVQVPRVSSCLRLSYLIQVANWLGFGWVRIIKNIFDWWTDSSVAEADVKQSPELPAMAARWSLCGLFSSVPAAPAM